MPRGDVQYTRDLFGGPLWRAPTSWGPYGVLQRHGEKGSGSGVTRVLYIIFQFLRNVSGVKGAIF